jgi:hypothetical protein
MRQSKTSPGRLNIYVHDPAVRRQVKAAAAKRDLSVTEYCLRAILRQLAKDGERLPQRTRAPLEAAARQARQFQAETFQGRAFSINSAELITEARVERGRAR